MKAGRRVPLLFLNVLAPPRGDERDWKLGLRALEEVTKEPGDLLD